MAECQVIIPNKLGLHARASAKLVKEAAKFSCKVELIREHMEVNAKSIMGVLLLAASQGTELTLRTTGEDAEAAMNAIRQLIEDGFGEHS